MPRTPWRAPRTLAPGWRFFASSTAPTSVWLMTAVGPPPCAITKVADMPIFPPASVVDFHANMARRRRTRNAAVGKDRSADDDRRLAGDPAEQVDHVLVDHPHAARRYSLADGPPFGRAMHAVTGV